MLGSVTEADDAVQEAWIRLSRTDTSDVDNLRAWLTTVVARVCLNMLRSRRRAARRPSRRHVPDPIVSPRRDGSRAGGAAGDSVGLALLVVLDSLTPAERVAFVLHDVFAVPFDEIAPIVGRTPDATRQLASRARAASRAAPVPDVDLAASGRSSTPSWRAAGTATSNACSPCSIRTSSCDPRRGGPTGARLARPRRGGRRTAGAELPPVRRDLDAGLVNGIPGGVAWLPDGTRSQSSP
jgi:RNA polymerase sigma-70 factor (ECF subfamily)